jgi:hypothetical protein
MHPFYYACEVGASICRLNIAGKHSIAAAYQSRFRSVDKRNKVHL